MEYQMPRPIVFLIKYGIIALVIYGSLFAIAEFWSPEDRQMESYIGRVKISP